MKRMKNEKKYYLCTFPLLRWKPLLKLINLSRKIKATMKDSCEQQESLAIRFK